MNEKNNDLDVRSIVTADAPYAGNVMRIPQEIQQKSVLHTWFGRVTSRLEVCSKVIRSYLKRPNRNLSQLAEYAKRLRVANVLKNYLEIAIE